MDLSSLTPPKGSRKNRKRVGRGNGNGHGGTSGKGAKGQNARSGHSVRPSFEGGQMPLSRRIPKRGFKNPNRKVIATVNIKDLKMFAKDAVVDASSLRVQGLISGVFDGVKVLGAGEIDYPLSIQVDMISSGARKKIQAAGGTIIEVI